MFKYLINYVEKKHFFQFRNKERERICCNRSKKSRVWRKAVVLRFLHVRAPLSFSDLEWLSPFSLLCDILFAILFFAALGNTVKLWSGRNAIQRFQYSSGRIGDFRTAVYELRVRNPRQSDESNKSEKEDEIKRELDRKVTGWTRNAMTHSLSKDNRS